MEVLDKKLSEELSGKASGEQLRLRRAYQHWGIPVSEGKSLVRTEKAEKLGAILDGIKKA